MSVELRFGDFRRGLRGRGVILNRGRVGGAATMALSASGAVLADGAVAGSATMSLAGSGTVAVIAAAGSATLSLAGSGAVLADGAVSGSAAAGLSASGTVTGADEVSGAAALALTASGAVVGEGEVAGTAALQLAASGALVADGEVAGAGTVSLSASGAVAGDGAVAGTASVALSASGTITGITEVAVAGATTMSLATAGGIVENNATVTLGYTTGLVHQLDAANLGSLTTSGSEVTGWEDQGSAGVDMARHASDDGPTLVRAGLNGRPYLAFNGSDESLINDSASGLPVGSSARTAFIVARHHDNGGTETSLAYGLQATDEEFSLKMIQSGDDAQIDIGGTVYTGSDGGFDEWEYYTLYFTPSLDTIGAHKHETLIGEAYFTPVDTAGGGTPEHRLGRNLDDAFSEIDVAEVLIYNSLLNGTNTQAVWDYLAAKWGI